jgi:hypothetical protein
VKNREATKAEPPSSKIWLARRVPNNAARDMATGSNTVVLGPRHLGVAEGREDEEQMADVDETEEEAAGDSRDVIMAETETETATRTTTNTKTEIETGAQAADD